MVVVVEAPADETKLKRKSTEQALKRHMFFMTDRAVLRRGGKELLAEKKTGIFKPSIQIGHASGVHHNIAKTRAKETFPIAIDFLSENPKELSYDTK